VAHTANSPGKSANALPEIPNFQFHTPSPRPRGTSRLTGVSFEFVAKPDKAADATRRLPAAIQSGLEDLPSFAGSLVMVSGQEARLITVLIFWDDSGARKNFDRGVRRVRALLAPYLDRCLRTQEMRAHLPILQNPQASSIDSSVIAEESVAQGAIACIV
jgi:hypothetical protein